MNSNIINTSSIDSVTVPRIKNPRNSNIEFLRIVAMFMVLGLHVNFMSIGEPTTEESVAAPLQTFSRVFFQQACSIAVNLFVLISGWYAIKFSFRSLMRFVFQSVFLITLMYGIGLIFGLASLTPKEILECLFLEKNAWFVKVYIGLFILSPVLNYYCQNADKMTQRTVLICFYAYQTIFGAFTMSSASIMAGYSVFSFIGLYLLAQYIHRYNINWTKYGIAIFVTSIIGATLWFYIPLRLGVMRLAYMSVLYTSPFTITGALGLLLAVANLRA